MAESPSSDGNKVLSINKTSSSDNRHVRFDFNTSLGNNIGDIYTVKMKIYISSEGAVDGANFADMDFRNISAGAILYTARMVFRVDESGNTTVYLCGNIKGNYTEFVSDIPTDQWVELEMSCRRYLNESGEVSVDSDILIGGERVGGHTGVIYTGSSLITADNIDRFNIKSNKNTVSQLYIDDLYFTRSEAEE